MLFHPFFYTLNNVVEDFILLKSILSKGSDLFHIKPARGVLVAQDGCLIHIGSTPILLAK